MKFSIDGSVVDTDRAFGEWDERRDFNGKNRVGRSSGSQWAYETLYRSSKGRYYLVTRFQWQGSRGTARFVPEKEAAAWLMLNEHELPAELAEYAAEIVE